MPGSWPQRDLPHLHTGNCQITSPATRSYNCIAWAAGTDKQWWDPHPLYRWPSGVPREVSIDAFLQVYASLGYEICIGGEPEEGFDKIAIFAKLSGTRKVPTHVARQIDSGEWTSKLGPCEDITHSEVHNVNGPIYGEVIYFMSRPKPKSPASTNI
jgi:hypothetical protein